MKMSNIWAFLTPVVVEVCLAMSVAISILVSTDRRR